MCHGRLSYLRHLALSLGELSPSDSVYRKHASFRIARNKMISTITNFKTQVSFRLSRRHINVASKQHTIRTMRILDVASRRHINVITTSQSVRYAFCWSLHDVTSMSFVNSTKSKSTHFGRRFTTVKRYKVLELTTCIRHVIALKLLHHKLMVTTVDTSLY